ncbi:MAG TPA: SufE family protein [Bacteroidales bacterium]|jgi:cysteine desulfuration protein SufE|nr:MAG: Cysteine desulfuration protein SufE [Bacteroidetes bacterium ADurb.Bin090]HOD26392.1 SufE family protein [Bacteroidales bacterium]HPB35618.1 SufE family protein [Bacteroidales bacterium]HPH56976.1 SufE family protein [Bacteroidales bacterium]HPN47226.1 SufE family protein [Bacteroidales bacterium]
MSIDEVQDDIIQAFDEIEDWMDKYQLLIDMGNSLSPLDEQYKKPQYLIEGCQSRVWIHADYKEGKVFFEAESDTVIVKGLVYLLLKVFSGRTPDEILDTNLYFIERIGLKEHLSPTRSNGFAAMLKQIRNYALAFKLS